MSQYNLNIAIIICISLILCLPGFIWGSGGEDLLFHQLRMELVSQHFDTEWSYPRILQSMNAGCSGFDLWFYPPMAYLFSGFVDFLIGNIFGSWTIIMLCSLIALLLACWGCYRWTTQFSTPSIATTCTILYATLPYSIISFYHNFMWPQWLAFSITPWLFYAAHRLESKTCSPFIVLALGYALLVMTNIPATLLIAPLPMIYSICVTPKNTMSVVMVKWLGILLIAFMLSAFYTLPMLTHLAYVYAGHSHSPLLEGSFGFEHNFLFSSFNVKSIIALIVLLASSWMWLAVRNKLSNIDRKLSHFCFALIVISFFLTTSVSTFIWDMMLPLQLLQFPERLLMIQNFAWVGLCAIYFKTKQCEERFLWGYLPCIVILLVISSYPSRWSVEHEKLPTYSQAHALSENFSKQRDYFQHTTSYHHEFIPITVSRDDLSHKNLSQLKSSCLQPSSSALDTSWHINTWHSRYIDMTIKAPTDTTILLPRFSFPGWEIAPAELTLTNSLDSKFITITVPQGNYSAKLILTSHWSEKLGVILGALGLILILTVIRRDSIG